MESEAFSQALRLRLPAEEAEYYLGLWWAAQRQDLSRIDTAWVWAELWRFERRFPVWARAA